MKLTKYTVALALGFFLAASSVFAQGQQMKSNKADSITDQELQSFAQVTQQFQTIQRQSQQTIDSLLSEKDMDIQRFQQIMMSKRNPKMADSLNMTDKEKETMKELQPELMKMQQESRQQMMGIIQDNGLSPQRFQAISRAVRTKPEMMKRFQKIARDTMQQ
ncbi:MAG: DUF4168 domain-containing protein [Balneolaceae bacterium]|jgi:hypothetical protein